MQKPPGRVMVGNFLASFPSVAPSGLPGSAGGGRKLSGAPRKGLERKKQVKGTEKSHYKRKILFQLSGQPREGREPRRAGRSCLEAENPAFPVPHALAPDHPEGSSLDSHQSCSALRGWAAQFRTWSSQHCLTVQHSRIVPEGGQREQAPAPCPRAQGQQERAAFAITLGPEPRGALAISTLLLV